jgi:hypothetical protein
MATVGHSSQKPSLNEKLLHFIWHHGHFDKASLSTSDGRPMEIIDSGMPHLDQGPDFRDARIRMGDTLWIGNVEIHVRTSDWCRHGHDADRNYRNVILHVVWENDGGGDGELHVLELRDRVPLHSIRRLAHWMQGQSSVPCEKELRSHRIRPSVSFLERLVEERLLRKSDRILSNLASAKWHWEEVFWWQMARNFGYRVNADAFEEMAKTVKVRILQQNKHSIHLLEAVLLGQCNLLHEGVEDAYGRMLWREYAFARRKYCLQPIRVPVLFLRMRPSNFPTVRLAQLAMLVRESNRLFPRFRLASTLKEAKGLLAVTANDFWHYHYGFGKPSAFQPKTLGKSMIDNIIINTVVPFLYTYARHSGEAFLREKAMRWLRETDAESNSTERMFLNAGGRSESALDSQALLELRTHYCDKRRCLECDVCAMLLSRTRDR